MFLINSATVYMKNLYYIMELRSDSLRMRMTMTNDSRVGLVRGKKKKILEI